jgi:predicted AlkP superfamily pyrophosphatase or phosphodiesterase
MDVKNRPENALPQTAIYGMVMDHMEAAGTKRPKVLVIGLDGTRPDALIAADRDGLLEASLPGLSFYHAYAGGESGRLPIQATYTAPGFTSILTGQWALIHGVTSNSRVTKKPEVKTFLNKVLAGHPERRTAILAAWEAITDGSTYGDEGILRFHPDAGYYQGDYSTKDDRVVAEARRLIGEGFDCLFVVLDLVDHNGHLHGFSPEVRPYTEAIHRAIGMVAAMVDAARQRPAYGEEDWLVLVTTDHGGKGFGHGGQSPEERSTFIVADELSSTIAPAP